MNFVETVVLCDCFDFFPYHVFVSVCIRGYSGFYYVLCDFSLIASKTNTFVDSDNTDDDNNNYNIEFSLQPLKQRQIEPQISDEDIEEYKSIGEQISLLSIEQSVQQLSSSLTLGTDTTSSSNNENQKKKNTKNTMASGVGVVGVAATTSGSTTNNRLQGGRNHGSGSTNIILWIKRLIESVIVLLIRLIILYPFRTIYSFTIPFPETDELSPAVTAKAATQFVSYLKSVAQRQHQQLQQSSSNSNNHNSNNHNTLIHRIQESWYIGGFEGAKQEAAMNKCLLLIYLHSPFHRMADEIGMKFFNTNEFLDFVCPPSTNATTTGTNTSVANNITSNDTNQQQRDDRRQPQVIALGISIHTTQGAQLASMLQVTTYPALALLQPEASALSSTSSSSTSTQQPRSIPVQLILRAESLHNITLPKLLPHLYTCVTRYQTIVTEQELKRIQRQQEIELRKQQDEEYYATLIADQEREIRIQQEQMLQEKQEQEQIQKEQHRIQSYEMKKQSVPPEPPSSSGSNTTITTIRFVLPNGTKINRRFDARRDTIGTLRAFIEVYYHETTGYDDIGTVGLSTNVFPRTTFNETEQTNTTLQEAGLCPQAVLMVQDLDS